LLQIAVAAFEEETDVFDGVAVDRLGGESVDTGTEAAADVVLQAGAGMRSTEIDIATGDEEISMDQIDDAIGEVRREKGAVVFGAVLFEAAGNVDAGPAFAESELDVGIGFVVTQKDVEAGLLLLDEVVLEGESLFFVVDNDIFDIDGLAEEAAGFGVFVGTPDEIGADAGAKAFGLADVDDLTFGVFVEVDAGSGGEGADFGVEVHGKQ
jgi:hypothetical protein